MLKKNFVKMLNSERPVCVNTGRQNVRRVNKTTRRHDEGLQNPISERTTSFGQHLCMARNWKFPFVDLKINTFGIYSSCSKLQKTTTTSHINMGRKFNSIMTHGYGKQGRRCRLSMKNSCAKCTKKFCNLCIQIGVSAVEVKNLYAKNSWSLRCQQNYG